ncbi:MAG: carbamoyltransferase HypF [Vicinamibacterales bacterium]
MVQGRRIEIHGTVQGVGFRPWVYRLAQAEGVRGHVRNGAAGVTIEAFGTSRSLERFVMRLREAPPPAARIVSLQQTEIPLQPADGFAIVQSDANAERELSIPPDLATCPACEAEIHDPADRRYRYPFTNCTNCGPRFTIALDVPYDRAVTTMARFVMCPACHREYHAVADRRFHAQPNACPVCGPRLTAARPDGSPLDEADPIRAAALVLQQGGIVALKGLGGFHLACDATNAHAVEQLRRRKHRDEKPFAVMVRRLEEAEALAVVGPEARLLLAGPERPIVLLERREPSPLAAAVAPGNPLVGVMLAYTPLHQLLLDDAGHPLVMTSGNVSDEPIAFTNEDAVSRLGTMADLFLLHDRDIVTRCDDSVARVIAGRPSVLRRSRGYVPRAVRLHRRVEAPVLACGALLKNTFCLASRDDAWPGPHVGDLDSLTTYRAYQDAITRLERFLGIVPEVIAYDLHPGYPSTRYALERPEPVKVGVQHHHAHVVSLMAEHGLDGPVIGVAYDGTGYGLDGAAWGGEILVAEYASFTRVATFRPVGLAGVDQAIRQPWRIALSLLQDAFGEDAPLDRLPLFEAVPARDLRVVSRLLASGFQVAPAHGVGRYFDGVGALILGRGRATYEGQVALELNAVADAAEGAAYPYDLAEREGLIEIDLRRGVRALVTDLLAGLSPARLSARVHRTIGAATADVVGEVTRRHGHMPVALTGGCFQNTLLVDDVLARVPRGWTYIHEQVPPGDGGLALGQAVAADAMLAAGTVMTRQA